MEGKENTCRTGDTKLWRIYGCDLGDLKSVVWSQSHIARGGLCEPVGFCCLPCGGYLCLTLSAFVCDLGFEN